MIEIQGKEKATRLVVDYNSPIARGYRMARAYAVISSALVFIWLLDIFIDLTGWLEKIPKPDVPDIPMPKLKLDYVDLPSNWVLALLLIEFLLLIPVSFFVWFRRRPAKRVRDIIDTPFQPERMMKGSNFVNAKIPSFQFQVYGVEGNVLYKVGQGFRAGNKLITAFHNLDQYEEVQLETEKGAAIVSVSDWQRLEGDLASLTYSQSLAELLSLDKGRLNDVAAQPSSGLFASAFAFGMSSMGFIEPHRAFGIVKYTGSTVPGFSGCPYAVGKRIFGMHLGGSSENVGYDSAYISMLLRRSLESSEDYLLKQVKAKKRFTYQRSPYDPDEYRVKINGRFYMVDGEQLGVMMSVSQGTQTGGVDYEGEGLARTNSLDDLTLGQDRYSSPSTGSQQRKVVSSSKRQLEADDLYQDLLAQEDFKIEEADKMSECSYAEDCLDQISKNEMRAPRANAGALGEVLGQVVAPKRQPTQKKPLVGSSQALKTTDGRKQMLARRNEALKSIAQSLRRLRTEQFHLQEESSRKRLTESLSSAPVLRLEEIAQKLCTHILSESSKEPSPK